MMSGIFCYHSFLFFVLLAVTGGFLFYFFLYLMGLFGFVFFLGPPVFFVCFFFLLVGGFVVLFLVGGHPGLWLNFLLIRLVVVALCSCWMPACSLDDVFLNHIVCCALVFLLDASLFISYVCFDTVCIFRHVCVCLIQCTQIDFILHSVVCCGYLDLWVISLHQ